jgi:hypothetical protein
VRTVYAECTFRSLSLDDWSNFYVGAHWLATKELPDAQWKTEPHHGPLTQLLLIASHHLVEVMLYRCIREVLDANPGKFKEIETLLKRREGFTKAFTDWPAVLTSTPFDLTLEPYKSLKSLQLRRNDTVHKRSALASLEMGRSALFSAVEGARSIAIHFRGAEGFLYDEVLQKYPLPKQKWFSEVAFIERPTKAADSV